MHSIPVFLFIISFIFSVEYSDPNGSFYRDLADIAPSLDFGSYSDQHPLFTENMHRFQWLKHVQQKNKSVLGKMKDEAGGSLYISEAVCLRYVIVTLFFFFLFIHLSIYLSLSFSFQTQDVLAGVLRRRRKIRLERNLALRDAETDSPQRLQGCSEQLPTPKTYHVGDSI